MSNKMANISTLGKEILQAIENQRLTKRYLYEKLGISRGTLDNWISGFTAPNHNELQKIYEILNIDAQKPARSMRDVIEDGNYIGMHIRVYNQLDQTLTTQRELLKEANQRIKEITALAAAIRSGH